MIMVCINKFDVCDRKELRKINGGLVWESNPDLLISRQLLSVKEILYFDVCAKS